MIAERKFLPYCTPDIGEEEIAEVVDSLRSGWLTTGPKTRRLEEEFSEFLGGGARSLAVNSATSGLHLALEALGVGAGDEVITTTLTFTATAEVVRYLGADPVFVDIDPATFNIDPQAIGNAISAKTKAIIPVHYGGYPCDMEAILRLAAKHGLKVVEDAAHAFTSKYRGNAIGTLASHATVFSLYATKPLPAGEGGIVVSSVDSVIDRCKIMRLHGIDRDAFGRFTSDKPSWYYEVLAPGFKYNLTDIAAALVLPQLKRARELRNRREEMALLYNRELADLPLRLPPFSSGGDVHSWHLYVIRLEKPDEQARNRAIEQLSELGIGTSVHYIPLHFQPFWRDRYDLRPEMFPHATDFYRSAISIPLYTKMTAEDQWRVIDALRRVFR